MRNIVPCLTDKAVNISSHDHLSFPRHSNSSSSVQNVVTSFYKIILSTKKQLIITITWGKTNSAQTLIINFGNNPKTESFKLTTNSFLFSKEKGRKVYESDRNSNYKIIELFWDLSDAIYNQRSPEPVNGFYISVKVDSEVALVLGDMTREAINKSLIKGETQNAKKVSLVSRHEYCKGNMVYSTKARLLGETSGIVHDIVIICMRGNEGVKNPVLAVYIDKHIVVVVKRLGWNFRGNRKISVDGLTVDFLWDVHGWFFNIKSGNELGVFMFKTRGSDGRIHVNNNVGRLGDDDIEFSLLIYASKNIKSCSC